MNGGSTFILRVAREFSRRGQRCAVVLLSDREDPSIVNELRGCADIYYLRDFQFDRGRLFPGLLGSFAPLRAGQLLQVLGRYGRHIHAMSVFGLILGRRLINDRDDFRLTVGVYHQNEFLFRGFNNYFGRKVIQIFKDMPTENIIFYNEYTIENYRKFFNRNYSTSCLLPIGVFISGNCFPRAPEAKYKIISIGNLERFKTYNRHIIGVVAAMKLRFPEIAYEIYGDGPERKPLEIFARSMGVADRVVFHGALDYSKFYDAVRECDLFVGSGTALIEAASVNRPAMIGIESIDSAETYGFLSDARGFSYNENIPDTIKYPMLELVTNLFSSSEYWEKVARDCLAKSQEFSIESTVTGLEGAGVEAELPEGILRKYTVMRLAISAILMKVGECLKIYESFSGRRNQSY
jgi:1,2-diacylglycerol 3-alpha-glucosyltransferase